MPVITGAVSGGTVPYYESFISAKWGAAAGEAYVSYADAHPGLSPEQAANDFIEIVLVQGLDTALSAGLGGAGTALGQVPGAAAKGAQNAYEDLNPSQWLNKLGNVISSRGFWVRVAEGVLGLALVLVAVAELGKGTAMGNTVKKVPFI